VPLTELLAQPREVFGVGVSRGAGELDLQGDDVAVAGLDEEVGLAAPRAVRKCPTRASLCCA
jgi:hypothetical protein